MKTQRVLAVVLSAAAIATVSAACVPPGNAVPSDAGASASSPGNAPAFRPSVNVMTAPFEDNFDRPGTPAVAASAAAPSVSVASAADATADGASAADGAAAATATNATAIGPAWSSAGTDVWHIENGRLCGSGAHNHGLWLNKTLPVNARIEFDAISDSPDGDLKCEAWGDGHSGANSISYTNATSYVVIFGGWHNTSHKVARINEHGKDGVEIKYDKNKPTDDPREQPVTPGQVYHFKIERTDGKTVKWSVNGVDMIDYLDPNPLAGMGHDHFGFNDWEAKLCFDNVKVTPLP